MKKTLHITVEIDTEKDGPSYARPHYIRPGSYEVVVAKSEENEIVPTIAHELGHILGMEFSLPAARFDPRNPRNDDTKMEYSSRQYYNPYDPAGVLPCSMPVGPRIIASEEEAWDVAEMMFRIQSTRRRCIQTYKDSFEPSPFYGSGLNAILKSADAESPAATSSADQFAREK